MTTETTTNLHIYFVLDRSGSMASIATDVIGGFNSFLAAQRAEGSEALMTLIQFDSTDPYEVLANATPLAEIPDLGPGTFLPRGGTPLYDAMGHAIADATIRNERLVAEGGAAEEVLCIFFTDGEENQSREYDQRSIAALVSKREAEGWTFVYMGANQDAYAEGGKVAMRQANTANFIADEEGAALAFSDLSNSVSRKMVMMRMSAPTDNLDFFDGDKKADADAATRGSTRSSRRSSRRNAS